MISCLSCWLTDWQSRQAYAKEKWKDKKNKGKKVSMTDSLTKELLKFDLTLMLDASQINGMDHTLKLSSLSVCSSNHISEKRYRVRTCAQTPLYLYYLVFWLTYWMINFDTRWLTGRTPDWMSDLLMTGWLTNLQHKGPADESERTVEQTTLRILWPTIQTKMIWSSNCKSCIYNCDDLFLLLVFNSTIFFRERVAVTYLMCFLRPDFCTKSFPQRSHLYGFSPVWHL